MTRSDPPATPGPKSRTDATRPPRTRRGTHRAPYPSAPTSTAASRRGTLRAGAPTRPRTVSTVPTPATVWACGATPFDPGAPWPTPILTKIVISFSQPGDRVVMLPWPTAAPQPLHAPVETDGPTRHAPTAEPDDQLDTALAAIDDLNRTARVIHVEPDPTAGGPASRPFWADLPHAPDSPSPLGTDPLPDSAPDVAAYRLNIATGATDLIITSLRPEHSAGRASDHVALLAAGLLRVGGVLAVLTHSDWTQGDLIDPTGPIVAAAQNADLLYLQHIIALHTPIHRGTFAWHSHSAPAQAPARDRAHLPGQPAPHHRISSDVLVFAQPHDHEPPPLAPTAVLETRTLR